MTFDPSVLSFRDLLTVFFTLHQDYFENNTGQPYCMFVVAPKVAKFRKIFRGRLKANALAG